jgi:hypothetical protein
MNLGSLKRDLLQYRLTKRAAGAVLALALAAGVVAGREKPALELLQERAPQAAAIDDGIDLEKLRRGESSLPQNDPFARKSFGREGAVAVLANTPPAKPTAPALPFQYFGKVIENGKVEVFVMRGQDLLAVSAGQNLGDYRVDKVTERSISFTYLPLKTKQTLDIPAVN